MLQTNRKNNYLKKTGNFQQLSKHEGIIPALESSHAVAYSLKRAPQMAPDDIIIINMSGRGDKDVDQAEKIMSGPEEGKK